MIKEKRHLFKILFMLCVAFVCFTIGICSINKTTVQADSPANSTFHMDYGASVRIATSPYGIRFSATVGKTYSEDYSYHMMIFPSGYLTKYNLNSDSDFVQEFSDRGLTIADMEALPYLGSDGLYHIRGSLTTIRYANTNRSFFGIAYYKDSVGTRTYATYNEGDNERTIVNVASSALNSGKYEGTSQQTLLENMVLKGVALNQGKTEEQAASFTKNDLDYSLNKNSVSLVKKGTDTLSVTGLDDIGINVKWVSDDTSVAKVENGEIKGVNVGSTSVSALVAGMEYSATVSVTGGTSLINFNSSSDLTNVSGVSGRIVANTDILDNGVPYPCAERVVTDGSSLAFTVASGSAQTAQTAQITFSPIRVDETDFIYTRFATAGRFTKLEIYHSDRLVKTITQASSCYAEQMKWYEIELSARQLGAMGDAGVNILQYKVYNESGSAVTVYIDEIYKVASTAVATGESEIINFNDQNAIDYVVNTNQERPCRAGDGANIDIVSTNVPTFGTHVPSSALKISQNYSHINCGAIIYFPEVYDIDDILYITVPVYIAAGGYRVERLNIGFIDIYGTFIELWYTPLAGYNSYRVASFTDGVNTLSGGIVGMWISVYEPWSADFIQYSTLDMDSDTIDVYIEKIELVSKPSGFNYNFTSSQGTDLGINIDNDTLYCGIVDDALAQDGKAMKFIIGAGQENGAKFTLTSSVAINSVDNIYLYLKTTDYVNVYVNDKLALYAKYGIYSQIDIKSIISNDTETYGTSLESIRITRAGVEITCYIDGISFTAPEFDYNFSSLTDRDVFSSATDGDYVNHGIVSDASANDGYALKVDSTPNSNWNNGGLYINLDRAYSTDDYEFAYINVKVESGATAFLFTDTSGESGLALTADGTYHRYSIFHNASFNVSSFSTINIQDIASGSHEIYIDEITFERYKYYDFNFATYTLSGDIAVRSSGNCVNHGIVDDALAQDGKAMKFIIGTGQENGAKLTLTSSVAINSVANIYLYLKTTDYVNVYVNDKLALYAKYDIYSQIDIKSIISNNTAKYGTSLESIRITRAGVEITCYIDGISFTALEFDYNFSSLTDRDVFSSATSGDYVNHGIVSDASANDGYALKVDSTPDEGWNNGGLYINLDSAYSTADYAFAYINIKVESGATAFLFTDTSGASGLALTADGTYHRYSIFHNASFNVSSFSTINIQDTASGSHEIYIDEITFEPYKYYDFNFATYTVSGDIDVSLSGNYVNHGIVSDASANDGYALKVDSTPDDDWNNGGLYINLDRAYSTAVYEMAYINIKVESGATAFLFTDTSGASGLALTADGAYHRYSIFHNASFNVSSFSTINIQDIASGSHEIYIDKIELFEKKPYSTSGGANVAALGFVEDNDAGRGYAFKLQSNTEAWYGQASISFESTYTFSSYANVLLKIKVDGAITLLINTDNSWGSDPTYGATFVTCGDTNGEYVYIDLKANAYINSRGTMNTIYFAKQGANTADIYIDDVIFTAKSIVNYSPSLRLGGAAFYNVAYVADNTCESGYATKVDVTSSSWGDQFLILDLATPLNPSNYQAVIVRIKASTANNLAISTDGWDHSDGARMSGPIDAANTWYEFDLMTVAEFRAKSSVTMIVFDHGSDIACTAYVDIMLVPKGDYSPSLRLGGEAFYNVSYVADNTCESGYATKVDVTSSSWHNQYLILDLAEALDPSRYQAVIVRIKADHANHFVISTDGSAWTNAQIDGPIKVANTWYEFDLMTVAAFREKPSVTMIVFDHGSDIACTAYVDLKLVPLNAN